MKAQDDSKNKAKTRNAFTLRLNIFFGATFLLFSILIVRLAILQFVDGPSLQEEFDNNSTRSVKIPPIRGNILDSTGAPIAYSTSTQSLYFTIQPPFKDKDADALAQRLFDIFNKLGTKALKPLTVKEIKKRMDLGHVQNTYSVPRRLKVGLSKEEIAYFSENREAFPGIDIVEESVRNYDKEDVAVQLVGYLKKFRGVRESMNKYENMADVEDPKLQYLDDEDVGIDGLEYMYQDVLRGKNGLKEFPVNAQETIIGPPVTTVPIKGDNIYLTIDKRVQLLTQQAITNHLDFMKHATSGYWMDGADATTGYAVAMEVNTGKVVAMASMPDYDPEVWAGGSISPEDYAATSLFQANGTIRQSYPPYADEKERNRHPSSIVPLGSTQKPLTVLIGLNEKLFSTHTIYNDRGVFGFGKSGHEVFIHDSQNHAYGAIDPASAIAHSSNTFMAEMVGNPLYKKYGNKGVDVWDSYVKQFGLGVSTGSGLLGESKGVIDYYHEAESASAQSALIRASFGQQAKYTTLQLAQYAAMLGNEGKRLQPQFVNKIVDQDGKVVQGFTPKVLNTVSFPQDFWDEIYEGMSKVSVQGFEGFKYNFLRKTGTSEQDVGDRKKVENSVFIALAPAEHPVLAVAVVVPDGGFGSYGAAPIARKIFDAYDEYVGLDGTPHPPATGTGNATGTGTTGTGTGH
ncbi:peptidoglycan D,D-transpeptidase FtsI family protein [Paenibacillus sacheonensis]|uniref:Penicillin-binding protein 2 n=1 Tax=Paenibacillus sacheonensis TaxID=742054 RepID=A0A7X4YLQ1_9BACL|nr:penicillin-binding transpeptidase domain-containing protein [Paenibacillus sacheonensis]MBM7566010.1 penicillin-binding protein 2 [Paenibacillus sacheonensis]NBC68678.1 penicillin-binding protein 2 [Paenibacillus sacheonensis]